MDRDLGFKSSDLIVPDHPELTVLLREREEEWGRLGPWASALVLLIPVIPLGLVALVVWLLLDSALTASSPARIALPFVALAVQLGFLVATLKAAALTMGRRRAWAEVLAQLESGSSEAIGAALRRQPVHRVRPGDLRLLLSDLLTDIRRPGFLWKATRYVGAVGVLIVATDWLFEWSRAQAPSWIGSLITTGLVAAVAALTGFNLWRTRRRQKAMEIEGLGEELPPRMEGLTGSN